MLTKRKVAIFGCGPAGLLAAHACKLNGYTPDIFSKKVKSKLGGAQYLHMQIPDLCAKYPDTIITYEVHGDAVTYQRKVYGAGADVPFVSFSNVHNGMKEPAWNLRRVYNTLWERWESRIIEKDISVATLPKPDELDHPLDDYDVVFSTVPLMALCKGKHEFRMQQVTIAPVEIEPVHSDTIVLDGTETRSWYRASLLFGEAMTEWGNGAALPPLEKMVKISKPIKSNCDCWPGITKLGRYGRWEKQELTHHSFQRVMERLNAL